MRCRDQRTINRISGFHLSRAAKQKKNEFSVSGLGLDDVHFPCAHFMRPINDATSIAADSALIHAIELRFSANSIQSNGILQQQQ